MIGLPATSGRPGASHQSRRRKPCLERVRLVALHQPAPPRGGGSRVGTNAPAAALRNSAKGGDSSHAALDFTQRHGTIFKMGHESEIWNSTHKGRQKSKNNIEDE